MIKKIIRTFAISIIALYVASVIAEGLYFGQGAQTVVVAGVSLTLASLIGKPVINILLLPLNLVTFGFFRWVASAVALYITTLLISDFRVDYFIFGGLSNKWLDLPAMNLTGFWAYIAFAFIFSLISSTLHWFAEK